ncbi:MAG: class I SAM-dependent methyltransferase [Sporichthyaceae bacterium]
MTGYLHATTEFDVELERLRLLERRYDAVTFRRLREFELLGARCLEVGAGAGSVARWFGEQVGPAGEVLAIDLDPRFLTENQGANVRVAAHDVLGSEPLPGGFDVAHCRALLIHLPDPLRAVRAMAAALRPGGQILLEDADMVAVAAADSSHSASAAFDRVAAAALAASDGVNFRPFFGRGLVPLARRAGLLDVRHEATATLRWGGTAEAEFMVRSWGADLACMAAVDRLGTADLAAWHAALTDPRFCFYDGLSVAVWARTR